jgi:hypothetical protein
VAFSSEFVDVVNPMAMLLLLASFTTGKVKRVELYNPQKLSKTDDGNVLFRARGGYMYVCRLSHRLSFVSHSFSLLPLRTPLGLTHPALLL